MALARGEPDRLPADAGSTMVTGIQLRYVAALHRDFGNRNDPVKVIVPGQMPGEVAGDYVLVHPEMD